MEQARICLISGANSGLGKVTAMELARQGFDIIMLCRDVERSIRPQQEIQSVSKTRNVYLVSCDLSSMDSVRAAAENIHHRFDHIDVLINNAGRVVDPLQYSPDGIELTFATNYLGPFLLTQLMLDLLRKSNEARIINVASELHRFARFETLVHRTPENYSALGAYNDSKLAKLLWTFELADRLMDDGITVNALHPWLVDTNFAEDGDAKGLLYTAFQIGKFFAPPPEVLAKTHVYLASSPEVHYVTGLYFANCAPYEPSAKAQDRELGRQLWQLSEQLTGVIDYQKRLELFSTL
ncbi:SDR family oxidoreductase [Tellurirhabdus rosea]|uniref:SDR family oxidoreductase n=1 Tax=Tellurirhabdus rosea TaxID=2674997 RepID=UPI0022519342|nr:SDR family oxidoreductase [Tellurirhabdus rosea]